MTALVAEPPRPEVTVTVHLQRREHWLKLQGDLLRTAGQSQAALGKYQAALAAIETLPPRLQQQSQVSYLRAALQALVNASQGASREQG